MKNHLTETVNAIMATFKPCCPSHIDSPKHIADWHENDTMLPLMSEEDARKDYLTRTGQTSWQYACVDDYEL